ncbi:nucleotidyltransferase domain-containing protein [Pseudobutyrivibrio xylanivorans]|uniref:Nucleotidyltransferase domain-containing protein n=1 Tax=Pseudobutyrivibrio xylanivorans DSM 14809 TaxID=1123012 RepID=A0A1M6K0F2_PSEXY|nr:nucleotidyltransferase domain-containing protein [Pseudobutyrivibrio xylanivorans]SHJ52364.1 Nucleotidyltransferase domain-containing protein [Pseudobutyrivibrio xylanivorans DSM 14809]
MLEYKNILDEFVSRVKLVLGKSFVEVILYGSYARGDNRDNSDIDIMLLTTLSDQRNKKS